MSVPLYPAHGFLKTFSFDIEIADIEQPPTVHFCLYTKLVWSAYPSPSPPKIASYVAIVYSQLSEAWNWHWYNTINWDLLGFHQFLHHVFFFFFWWIVLWNLISYIDLLGFAGGPVVNNPPASAGDAGDLGLTSGFGRFPGGGNGNLLQYFCLGNPMDGGAQPATVHGVAKTRTWLSDWVHTHTDLPQTF